MLLSIDIGNTTTDLAVCSHLTVRQVITVDNSLKAMKYKAAVLAAARKLSGKYNIQGSIICSVVPGLEQKCAGFVRKVLKLDPVIVGKDIYVPITNLYKNKKQVGQDRLVCAFAVKQLYGYPAIIIDLGTAITFDVITPKGQYEGGMIVPGIQMSTESLFAKTALLPKVKVIHTPKKLVGKTTEESILSGIFHGYGAMCTGLIDQLSKRFSSRPKVIVTGGHTGYMQKFITSRITKREPHLIFKGLSLIYSELC